MLRPFVLGLSIPWRDHARHLGTPGSNEAVVHFCVKQLRHRTESRAALVFGAQCSLDYGS